MKETNREQASDFNWGGRASDRWSGKPVLGGNEKDPVVHRVGKKTQEREWQDQRPSSRISLVSSARLEQ